jgi:hypothetical protein
VRLASHLPRCRHGATRREHRLSPASRLQVPLVLVLLDPPALRRRVLTCVRGEAESPESLLGRFGLPAPLGGNPKRYQLGFIESQEQLSWRVNKPAT